VAPRQQRRRNLEVLDPAGINAMASEIENPSQVKDGGRGRRLLLEQILEGLPRVIMARCRNCSRDLRLLGVGSWRGIFFNRHSKLVELAVIFRVLGRDALGDRLGALELRSTVEEPALFAGMQFELALGALSVGVEPRRQNRSAIGTAPPRDRADHARGTRAKLILARPARGWLPVMRFVFFFVLFGIAIAAVAVLSTHKRLRASVLADCNTKTQTMALMRSLPWHVSNRIATLGAAVQSSPEFTNTNRFASDREQEMGHLCF
jgi:hypothetical protein